MYLIPKLFLPGKPRPITYSFTNQLVPHKTGSLRPYDLSLIPLAHVPVSVLLMIFLILISWFFFFFSVHDLAWFLEPNSQRHCPYNDWKWSKYTPLIMLFSATSCIYLPQDSPMSKILYFHAEFHSLYLHWIPISPPQGPTSHVLPTITYSSLLLKQDCVPVF